jgi:hypothetical protein
MCEADKRDEAHRSKICECLWRRAKNILSKWRGSCEWHYATSWKVADSNPDEVIEFFNLLNPSGRTRPWGLHSP